MILTRTPLRVSIGGGGTDLPSYYQKFGSFFISAAIDQYVYIALNRAFKRRYFIKYSKLEECETREQIQHPIVRELFERYLIEPGVELVSLADIPAGTGLGSSSAFTVGVIHALSALRRLRMAPGELASLACETEMDRLKEPIGKQDQYIAAFGGITCFHIDKLGNVTVSPLSLSAATRIDLEENLLLFFTGISRSASGILSDQKQRSEAQDSEMIENLHRAQESGYFIQKCLETGDTRGFARLMHEHWERKRKRTSGMSSSEMDLHYESALANGALGGKIIGAGGGGFFLFYAEDRVKLRKAMAERGLQEVRFRFDDEGSKILIHEWR